MLAELRNTENWGPLSIGERGVYVASASDVGTAPVLLLPHKRW